VRTETEYWDVSEKRRKVGAKKQNSKTGRGKRAEGGKRCPLISRKIRV